MASRFFSINRGQNEFDVVEGAATTGADMELRIDLTKNLTQNEVNMAVEWFRNPLLKSTVVPHANTPAV